MTLPSLTVPTWIATVEISPAQGLGNLITNIQSDIAVIKDTANNANNIRKQVMNKASEWLDGVKGDVGGAITSLNGINGKISEYKNITTNILSHKDLINQATKSIESFLSVFGTGTTIMLAALIAIPVLLIGAEGVTLLVQHLNSNVQGKGKDVLGYIKDLTSDNATLPESLAKIKEFLEFVKTKVSAFVDHLINMPAVAETAENVAAVQEVAGGFGSAIQTVGGGLAPSVHLGLSTLEKQRPQKMIVLNPVMGGYDSLAEAIINSLGSTDPEAPVEG